MSAESTEAINYWAIKRLADLRRAISYRRAELRNHVPLPMHELTDLAVMYQDMLASERWLRAVNGFDAPGNAPAWVEEAARDVGK